MQIRPSVVAGAVIVCTILLSSLAVALARGIVVREGGRKPVAGPAGVAGTGEGGLRNSHPPRPGRPQ